MQLVVVMAVRKAVSAATIIFTAISISRFFFISIISHYSLRLSFSTFTAARNTTASAVLTASGIGTATRVRASAAFGP